MESLRISGLIPCNSFSDVRQARVLLANSRLNGQLGFASLWRRGGSCRRRRSLNLKAGSVSGGNEGALGGLREEEDEKKKKKGLLLGTERDGSGSVIGFHLIPPSGMFVFLIGNWNRPRLFFFFGLIFLSFWFKFWDIHLFGIFNLKLIFLIIIITPFLCSYKIVI